MPAHRKDRPIRGSGAGRRGQIDTFHIFGEAPRSPGDRFYHLERIGDRSPSLHGMGPPHRHAALHQLSLWDNHEGRYMTDGDWHPLPSRALTFVPAGTIHAFEVEEANDTIVLSLSENFLVDCLRGANGLLLATARSAHVFGLEDQAFKLLRAQFEGCEREYRSSRLFAAEAIAAHVRLIFLEVAENARRGDQAIVRPGQRLTMRFLSFLDAHHQERWSVARYAEALATTPHVLNAALRRSTGHLATELLRQRFVMEAKRLLMFTDRSIAEIAYDLGYEDSSHFSRAFRDLAGSTPTNFRQAAWSGDEFHSS